MTNLEKHLLLLCWPIILLGYLLLVVIYSVLATYRVITFLIFLLTTPFLVLIAKKYPEYRRKQVKTAFSLLIECFAEDWQDLNNLLRRV